MRERLFLGVVLVEIWHCLKTSPEVFEAAYSWVELCDFIPSVLAGVNDPKKIVRGYARRS